MKGQYEKLLDRVSFLVEQNQSQQEMINLLHKITVDMDKRIDFLEGEIEKLEEGDDRR